MNILQFKKRDAETPISRKDNYLARDIVLKESMSPDHVETTIKIAAGAFGVFLLWAGISKVDIVAHAMGQISPVTSVQVIQHQDGGIINRILVQDGQKVRKGQTLMTLDDTEVSTDLETARQRYWALFARVERLRAIIEGRAAKYDAVPPSYRKFVDDEKLILNTERGARQDQAEVLRAQLKQVTQEVRVLEELVSIRGDLAKDKLVSRTAFLDAERNLMQMRGQQNALKSELAAVISQRNSTAADEMGKTQAELAQMGEQVRKLEGRLARTKLVAPTDGIVQGMVYRTIGGVVAPGSPIMNVVPVGDNLVAEVRVSPSDVGHVRVNQPVRVKVSSYDFLRYGVLEGKVSMVSASSSLTEKGEPYFLARVALPRNQFGAKTGEMPLQSGMTVETDIVTDRQSVLNFLLRPIYKAFEDGFGER